jgi:transcriptional regulator with XRE-family HTH domain
MQEYRNIYQTSREHAGLTQEAAAEHLALSVESLRKYETGRCRPADRTVKSMVELYGDPYLGYLHMQDSPLADCLPQVRLTGIQQASMRIVRMIGRFVRDQRVDQLLEITEDGVIDADEQPAFHEIMDELGEIARSWLALGFCGHKKTPERVAAHSSVGR